jgi:hypothetical protein
VLDYSNALDSRSGSVGSVDLPMPACQFSLQILGGAAIHPQVV